MNSNEQAAKRYFEETAIVLKREGLEVEQVTDHLRVFLDEQPLCEVNEAGGVVYRSENISTPERIAVKDKVFGIACKTAEYMRQMELAPALEADGLEDKYKLLSEFNGTVLAGMHTKVGVVFTTWDRTPDGKGLAHGHYHMEDYDGAKQDFATRAQLIPEQLLFDSEQLIEIYRCCDDTLYSGFELTYEQEKCIKSVQDQILQCIPNILEQIQEQDGHMDNDYDQEPTM